MRNPTWNPAGQNGYTFKWEAFVPKLITSAESLQNVPEIKISLIYHIQPVLQIHSSEPCFSVYYLIYNFLLIGERSIL